ncbi:aminotransferase class I/II-fold pyridoxal phosphate-dependent enzyme [Aerococcaceae bacterium DSM 111176]|nr:aminotransferase class I/II-fold pyridoxal phosphate-dependent enzyme [Aerococcaceae bacterium DSM 111176]
MTIESKLNPLITQVEPSPIREFDGLISNIPGIIKLTLGEPDFPSPEAAKEAAINGINTNKTKYAPSPGTPDLLDNISDYLKRRYDLDYPKDQISVTVGATEALASAFLTILQPGDKVIVPNPMFSLYDTIIKIHGGEPIHIDTAENDFILSPEMIQKAVDENDGQVKAVLLNYPTNPTGVTWTYDEAKAIADICRENNLFVVSDEVYSEFVYDGEHVSMATLLPELTLLVNGVSKSHSMTGWRIGFLAGPENIMKYVAIGHQSLVTTASTVSQIAASAALEFGDDYIVEMREAFKERRDYFYDALTSVGFTIKNPNGAFYMFAEIPEDLNQDSFQFAVELAENAKVAGVPGNAFGVGGENYIRFSYAASLDEITEAADRIVKYVQSVRG